MYQFSLSSYLIVFNNSLREARKDTILENRLRNIIDKLTINVYDYTCLGVFEIHKLMFSFQMTIQILDGDQLLDKRELDFFLKGNTSLDEVDTPPPATWISISGWKDIQTLVNINEIFKNFINDLQDNLKLFK
jgi:dynein heavy chain